ncbi:hypothetical protein DFH29DRAFT_554014 [Suillus ampliporus]|nr:hypothetical protein DFH29DRAFT_554014 [Suillus ampliporus]
MRSAALQVFWTGYCHHGLGTVVLELSDGYIGTWMRERLYVVHLLHCLQSLGCVLQWREVSGLFKLRARCCTSIAATERNRIPFGSKLLYLRFTKKMFQLSKSIEAVLSASVEYAMWRLPENSKQVVSCFLSMP